MFLEDDHLVAVNRLGNEEEHARLFLEDVAYIVTLRVVDIMTFFVWAFLALVTLGFMGAILEGMEFGDSGIFFVVLVPLVPLLKGVYDAFIRKQFWFQIRSADGSRLDFRKCISHKKEARLMKEISDAIRNFQGEPEVPEPAGEAPVYPPPSEPTASEVSAPQE
ncbi:hypothetical protein ACFL54_03180 [Planctomycetota bacterium]